jgi:hypothetical protein
MTGKPEVMLRMDSQRRWPEVDFEEMCIDGPTPLTDISLKPFMGSNPVSRTQPSVNERFGLLASTENGSRRCRRPCSFTDTRRRNWTQFDSHAPARFRKPIFSHAVAFKTLWLSNCFSE